MSKLEIFTDLMQIMEQAFVYKLKQKTPGITEEEIEIKIQEWYACQPMIDSAILREADVGRVI